MDKKRILILSYFFPPCNLTAANRPYGWAKFFAEFGYRPTIITRNWNIKIENPSDLHKAVGNQVEKISYDTYDLILVPFKPSFRDKLFTKKNASGLDVFFRKLLTIVELLLQNLFRFATPYMDIYRQAEKELEQNKYDALLVTGNPFTFFKFGHLLSKKYNTKWFADYRDDWTTSESINLWYNNIPIINIIAKKLEQRSEKKWLSNATCFFSISENYVEKISNFIGIKGHVIYNGFIAEDFEPYSKTDTNNDFTVCFNGTLIDIQPIEIFLEAYKKLITHFKPRMKLKLVFVGTSFHSNQETRLLKILAGFEQNFEITKRINHAQAIEMQAKSHVLLLVAFAGITGAPGSKIFDYLALQKPILLCPSDNGIKEKITTSTNQAIICNTESDVYIKLETMIECFIKDKNSIRKNLNMDAINFYSRQNQSKLMVEVINSYLNNKSS